MMQLNRKILRNILYLKGWMPPVTSVEVNGIAVFVTMSNVNWMGMPLPSELKNWLRVEAQD